MALKVYLANDLFGEANRQYNENVVQQIEKKLGDKVEMILPQRDDSINDKQAYANSLDILRADYTKIKDSDVILAILDSNDVGVALEIGIAYEAGIPVIGLFTDVRQQDTDNKKKVEALSNIEENQLVYLNPMLSGAIKNNGVLVNSVEEAIQELRGRIDTWKPGGRYLVFSYDTYYPGGGMEDLDFMTADIEEIAGYIDRWAGDPEKEEYDFDHLHVYDTAAQKVIYRAAQGFQGSITSEGFVGLRYKDFRRSWWQ